MPSSPVGPRQAIDNTTDNLVAILGAFPGDPQRALAAAQLRRGVVMAETLKLTSGIMEDKTDHLKRINDLIKELQELRPNGTDPNKTTPALAGDDLNDPAALARANRIMDALHAENVAMDQPPGYDRETNPDVKFMPGTPRGFAQYTYDDWISQLKINVDNIQLTTQQEQTNLQTSVSLFNKVYETASQIVSKNYQTIDLITQAIRT
ncbi:MAG: hypothetical protein ACO1N5_13435 [Noviherbaspirillum sp.]